MMDDHSSRPREKTNLREARLPDEGCPLIKEERWDNISGLSSSSPLNVSLRSGGSIPRQSTTPHLEGNLAKRTGSVSAWKKWAMESLPQWVNGSFYVWEERMENKRFRCTGVRRSKQARWARMCSRLAFASFIPIWFRIPRISLSLSGSRPSDSRTTFFLRETGLPDGGHHRRGDRERAHPQPGPGARGGRLRWRSRPGS